MGRAPLRVEERARMMTLIRGKTPVSFEDAVKLVTWYIAADSRDRHWLALRSTFRDWYKRNRETVDAVAVLLDARKKIEGRFG